MWTKELPTEPGDYWFYGYRYGRITCGIPNDPEWKRVQVHRIANGLMYNAEGQFLYEEEVEDAHFMPLEYPEPPDIPTKLGGE